MICRIINVEVRVISRAEGEADNSYRDIDNFAGKCTFSNLALNRNLTNTAVAALFILYLIHIIIHFIVYSILVG